MLTKICLVAILCSTQLFGQDALLSGHLFGRDGKAMPAAAISVFRFGSDKADSVFAVQESGGFLVTINRPGFYRIEFSGVNHEPWSMPLIVNRVLREEIEVQLANTVLPSGIDSVHLIGKFNNFNRTSGVRMNHGKNGYACAAPSPSRDYAYQVMVFGNRLTAGLAVVSSGTTGEEYELREGHFASVMNAMKEPEVHFDASRLSSTPSPLQFKAKNPILQHCAELFTEMMQFRKSYEDSMEVAMMRHTSVGGDRSSFDVAGFDSRMKISSRVESLRAMMSKETDETSLQLLYIYYLSIPSDRRDNLLLEKALRVITPSSVWWSIDPQLLYTALNARQRETKDQYINEVLAHNQNENVVVKTAYSELMQAFVIHDKQREREMYKIITEKYPDHPLAVSARYYYNPDRSIRAGNKIPAFSFSAGSQRETIGNESLKSKYTLIDFWSDNTPSFESSAQKVIAAFAKYTQKPVQLMCVSVGKSTPVLHNEKYPKLGVILALAAKDKGKDPEDTFEIIGFPYRILVGPDLRILASGSELTDDHLEATLQLLLR